MLRIALRNHRIAFLAFSAVGFIVAATQVLAFDRAAGSGAAQRAVFGGQMTAIGRQVGYLLPLPERPDTVAGYVHWRVVGSLVVVLAAWAGAAASGAIRRDEDRLRVEHYLASGVSRRGYVWSRMAAFALASGGAILVMGLGAWVVNPVEGRLPLPGLTGDGVVLWVFAIAVYCLVAAVVQLPPATRTATGVASGVVVVLFLADSIPRSVGSGDALRWLSPFWYAERSDPLVPGGRLDLPGLAVLALLGLLGAVAAAELLARRDLGRGLLRARRTRRAGRARRATGALRIPLLRDLWTQRGSLFWWALGTGALAVLMVSLAPSVVSTLRTLPGLARYRALLGDDLAAGVVGAFLFGTGQLLLAIFAVMQVARWTADEASGRLGALLSTPTARLRVVLERAAGLAVSSTVLAVVLGTVAAAVAPASGVALGTGALASASALLIPFALSFGAVGAVVAARAPRLAVGVLSLVAVVGYFIQQLAPLFDAPAWVPRLSVFSLYGTPLVGGVDGVGLALLLGITAVGFALAAAAFRRHDVVR